MTLDPSRPPRVATALFLVATFGVGGWVMAHTYNEHDPGLCGGMYQRAHAAADSALVDRFVPDSERGRLQPRPCALLRGATPEEFARADSLLSRAIMATGGDPALAQLTAIEWEGRVTVGDSTSPRMARWRVAPPDTEVVTTWSASDSAATRRLVVVMGTSVWAESNGDSVSLTPDERSNERHLAYLYGLLRLLPLHEPGATIRPLPVDSAGRPGILARTPGHLDAALYFGADGRVAVVRTTVIPSPGASSSTTTATFSGTTELAGVHWFHEMQIVKDGVPSFDLTISAARPATTDPAHWVRQE